MKLEAPQTYQLFEAFEGTHDILEKIEILRKLNRAILHKAGGVWEKDEIIFHYADDSAHYSEREKAAIVELIF